MTEGQSLYRVDEERGCAIVSFSPEMSNAQMSTVDSAGSEVLARLESMRSPRVIVDLTSLNYMGSAMVALIVRIWKGVNARDGRMAVVNNNDTVQEVLRISGLEQVWTIVPTREDAFRELGARKTAGAGSEGSNAGLVLLGLGLLALAGAVAGLILMLGKAQALTDQQAFIVTVACAILGLVLSGIAAFREAGSRRIMAGVLAVASLVVLVIGLVRSPVALAAAEPAEANTVQATPSE